MSAWVAVLQQGQATPVDSVVVESPLPRGVAAVTRFLLNTVPQSVQLAGLVVAVIAAVVLAWYLVRHRAAIRSWFASRSRAVKVALAAGAVVLVGAMVGMGRATWNYTQHSNEFCTSCHVMDPAFQRFGSTTNKHNELSCHACHTQSVFASAWQLYLWLRERPDKIGKHATVPNRVCESCHVTGDTARWQHIALTAGHRVHLESDSSALRDVQCVKCHGVEIHRFKPVSNTCGQSGCHEPADTRIAIGRMAEQTALHCTSCHEFTAEVPALATRDSAQGTLVPGKEECLACHQMQRVVGTFNEAKDPHGGKCGTCHNPHEQQTPREAANTCATAGCHANWRDEPFHVGTNHRRVATRCLTCHLPHQAQVDASDCTGCHTSVRSRGNLRPPLPFDTSRALRPPVGNAGVPHAGVERLGGPSADDEPALPALHRREIGLYQSPIIADTFSHARHEKLACLVCHPTGSRQGRLTFEPPRGCLICHHRESSASGCASCHQPDEIATSMAVTFPVTVRGHQAVPRTVDFRHTIHGAIACRTCHIAPVTLAPSTAVATCQDCHDDHHDADRACSACHVIASAKAGHPTPDVAHQHCDACHAGATVARLTPTRSLCATCHAMQATNHFDGKECTTCHFLTEPGAYRTRLTTRPG